MENTSRNPKQFPPEGSFQLLPSLLIYDLTRHDAKGRAVLELNDIAVYLLLRAHAFMKGRCHPSNATLARLAGCSVPTIQRSIRRLVSAGHIQRIKGEKSATTVLLTDVKEGRVVKRAIRAISGVRGPRQTPRPTCYLSVVPKPISDAPENVVAPATDDEELFEPDRTLIELYEADQEALDGHIRQESSVTGDA